MHYVFVIIVRANGELCLGSKNGTKIPEIRNQVLTKSFTIRPITRIIFDSQQNINQKKKQK